MEDTLIKLLTQFGVSGIIGALLWITMKEHRAETKAQLTKLEGKIDQCEKDREALWERLTKDD